ncbi:hypothetical protein [Enterococcus sp. AZ196]|uniref:hypothetical protein n=1 Tax=Enterococcus sp. AZ196 TaxID=2774659 RepID=UPI003D2E59A1
MIVEILEIVSGMLAIAVVILMLLRLNLDRRFSAIQKEEEQSSLFQRKMAYVKKLEQEKHIRSLIRGCLFLGVTVIIVVSAIVILADTNQKLKKQTTKLTDRIEVLEQQQHQLVASIPLRSYPEKGIGLKDYDWKKLTGESKDSTMQKQIESDLSKETSPYFGALEPTVSLAVPKTVSLQLKSQTEDDTSKETIKENIDAFAKEAEAIPELTEVHVRMVTSIGETKKVIYSVTYSREKSEEGFKKMNVSEQNLKNDGGKG